MSLYVILIQYTEYLQMQRGDPGSWLTSPSVLTLTSPRSPVSLCPYAGAGAGDPRLGTRLWWWPGPSWCRSVVADVVSVGGAAAAGGQGRDLHLNFSQVLGRAGRREARTRPELATALPPPSSALGSSPARHQPSPHYTSHHPDMRAILSGGRW